MPNSRSTPNWKQPSTEAARSLLLIGKSKAGKTHYGGQLLGRLNQNEGRLQKRATPENVEPFEEVLQCLNRGVPAAHTPTNAYKESVWPVQMEECGAFDLIWPDYGGEQIRLMVDQRRVDTQWRQRLLDSQGWLVFVRLGQSKNYEDVFTRPSKPIANKSASAKTGRAKTAPQKPVADENSSETSLISGPQGSIGRWAEQAFFIELFQLLLFMRGAVGTRKVKRPALGLVLSCWDELNAETGSAPSAVLQEKMPLLAQFIASNWEEESAVVFGLSALERPLSPDAPDEAYINEGPDNFGYVVCPDGTHSSDLTLPLSFVMEQVLSQPL